ncbi:MAG TPA: ATP-binding protein [Chitinophagaceae bacterium]|nr:ATP-binding protein [Chitinophagaceae bacterium]
MRNQTNNFKSPIQPENFIVTNSPEVSLNNFEDNLYIAASPPKKYVLKIPVTLDPSVFVHEIRNPLTNINLAVFMLKAEIKMGDIDKYVDIIDRSSVRINEILNEFLQSSRNDPAKRDRISINQLLDEILVIVKDRLILKNISVKKFYTTSFCELLLDKPKITIALLNIIVNAIEAMTSENGELKLTTLLRNGKCIVTIEDNGCGINKKNIKKIFKPYFTSKPNGMGIGLAATYDILAAHKAGVNVESEENKGTRFIISFNIS